MFKSMLIKVGIDPSGFTKGLDRMEKQLIRKGRRMSVMGSDLQRTFTFPLVAGGAAAVKAFADIDRLQQGLKAMIGDAGMARKEYADLIKLARNPGLSIERTIGAFLQLKAVNDDMEENKRIIKEWSNAIALAGGTSADFERVLVQLRQSISLGKIVVQDWKPILQQSPLVAKALDEIYGTSSIEEIREFGETSRDVIGKLTDYFARLERAPDGPANAIDNFFDELKTNFALLGKEIYEGFNLKEVMSSTTDAIAKMAKAFSELSPEMKTAIKNITLLVVGIGPMLRLLGNMYLLMSNGISIASGFAKVLLMVRTSTLKFSTAITVLLKKDAAFALMINKWTTGLGQLAAAVGVAVLAYKTIETVQVSKFSKKLDFMPEDALNRLEKKVTKYKEISDKFFLIFSSAKYQKMLDAIARIRQENPLEKAQDAFGQYADKSIFGFLEKRPSKVFGALDDVNKKLENTATTLEKTKSAEEQRLEDIQQTWKDYHNAITNSKVAMDYLGESSLDVMSNITSTFEKLVELGISPATEEMKALVAQHTALKEARENLVVDTIPTLGLPKTLSPSGGANMAPSFTFDAKKWIGDLTGDGLIEKAVEQFGSLENAIVSLGKISPEALGALIYATKQAKEELGLTLKQVDDIMIGAINSIMSGVVDAISKMAEAGKIDGKALWDAFVNPIIDAFKGVLIASGIAAEAWQIIKSTFTWTTGQAIIAAGVGLAALTALQAVVSSKMNGGAKSSGSSLPSYAEGTIAMRPHMAMVGDNPRSPEVIAPLHKLSKMLNLDRTPVVQLSGNLSIGMDDLVFEIQNRIRRNNFNAGY